jgi:two-component system phosphoglycerate transport system response regulator PgtA
MTTSKTNVDVMVVDDDIDLLTSMAELLSECGYRVKAFADADSALEYAVDRTFSVGLFDYRLGSLKNGLDVVEILQSMGCKASYVMITADVEQATAVRALHLNLFDFMKKPVEPEKLIGTVQRAIDHAQSLAA